ncbi:MAG: radical SAM protein, partial [Desulfobacterales bacterium]
MYNDLDSYLTTQRYVKPAWVPNEYSGQSDKPCPDGCGFCDRHEQHLCMPIVEITSRCDMTCPVCIADAGREWDMALEEFKSLIDNLIRAENQIDVINLSGGEPLLHPQLLDIIDEAISRPEIVRVSISTNGLTLLEKPSLVQQLHERNVVLSLQFDGFNDKAYQILRGQKLLTQKLEILKLLAESNISTSLTVTAADKVNTDQFPQIVEYLLSNP